jgi:hypothetical protein
MVSDLLVEAAEGIIDSCLLDTGRPHDVITPGGKARVGSHFDRSVGGMGVNKVVSDLLVEAAEGIIDNCLVDTGRPHDVITPGGEAREGGREAGHVGGSGVVSTISRVYFRVQSFKADAAITRVAA